MARPLRILLSEGSSLSARETVTALGPLGHRLEVCDPNPLCLARFSRWVSRRRRVPAVGEDPAGYVRAVTGHLERERHDVLLPVHEQVLALAAWRELLPASVGVALPPFEALREVQSKASFARLFDRLGLPQPHTDIHERLAAEDLPREYPYYVKRAIGTAGRAVWRVADERARETVLARLAKDGAAPGEVLVQAEAPGTYCQAQALFAEGQLIALHCSRARAVGMGGSASARAGVDHPAVLNDIELLGCHLSWHGALTLDYFHDERTGQNQYIEANPRLVEPMNAAVSGVNLGELLVRLSLGQLPAQPTSRGRRGIRSHGLTAVLLGAADRTRSRRALLRLLVDAARGRGVFADSTEALTPVRRDPISMLPAVFIVAQLMVRPRSAAAIAARAVGSYALTPQAVETIENARPRRTLPRKPPRDKPT